MNILMQKLDNKNCDDNDKSLKDNSYVQINMAS